jgi:hypothetical protein
MNIYPETGLFPLSLAEKHWKNIGRLVGDFKETQIFIGYPYD